MDIEQIKRDLGLITMEDQPVAQHHHPIVDEINEYLASDTLSNTIVQLEKAAGVQVSDEIKTFVMSAEEQGIPEDDIINFVFEKKGYRIPRDENDSLYKELLHKAANCILETTGRLAVMNDQLEMVKVAMDMVQSEQIAPFISYEDLTEKLAELYREGDPDLLKRATELVRSRVPEFGKVSIKRGAAVSATDRFLEGLTRINQGE